MTDRVQLHDGRLRTTGKFSWPTHYRVSAQRAICSVWELIPGMQSTRMACGYVARELDLDPIVLLAAVTEDQLARQKSELPAGTEPSDVDVDSMFSHPDGGTVHNVKGDIFVRRRLPCRVAASSDKQVVAFAGWDPPRARYMEHEIRG